MKPEMTETWNRQYELLETLKETALELSDRWIHEQVEGYPPELPSFDELAHSLLAIRFRSAPNPKHCADCFEYVRPGYCADCDAANATKDCPIAIAEGTEGECADCRIGKGHPKATADEG